MRSSLRIVGGLLREPAEVHEGFLVASHYRDREWALPSIRICFAFLVCWFLSASSVAADAPSDELTFAKDVQPILESKCVKCHSGPAPKGGLDLRRKDSLLRGGDSGPALTQGAAESSLLWQMIVTGKMPAEGEKLTATERAVLRSWINAGAKGEDELPTKADDESTSTDVTPELWSFRKPVRPPVPQVQAQNRVRTPIDAFILAALEARGLSLSPEADRIVLLRRTYYDLLGLPPTPVQVAEFLADTADDAYEKLIDRLLASPHYGERWGRHWLDVAGYADSEGILSADYVRSAAWRYRDYVIQAFNNDKPYDRFLQEQIAGDELIDYWAAYATQKKFRPEQIDALVATGYLRCASDTSRPDFANIKNAAGYYYQTIDDTLKIVASSTMGLTLQCAKCHSHKYDPIPQTDYYRLQAVFMGAYRPGQWVPQVQRRLLEATQAEEQTAKAHNDTLHAEIAGYRKQIDALNKQYGERLFDERLAKLPQAIREDVRSALAAAPAKRTEVQKYLADKFQKELRPDAKSLPKILAETFAEYAAAVKPHEAAIATVEAKRIVLPEIRALYDLAGQVKTPLLRRGDYRTPGPEMQPGTLAALPTTEPFRWTPPAKDAKTSGRRTAFARWLTQPEHPLTARVMVNRIWLHHFGEGIVATPDDFGNTGSAPSHPELFDWLAREFVDRGWSIKQMHRLMMTSSVYRQQSVVDPNRHAAASQNDPNNRLLWRQRLRRLEAESLRDAILSVAGTINVQMFGPPVPMQRQADGEVTTPAGPTGNRRSIYLQVRRSQPLTLLQLFDQPVMETNCARRGQSTVSLQALTLLNSDALSTQSAAFADRLPKENPADAITLAVQSAFARQPTAEESRQLQVFVAEQTKRYGVALPDKPEESRRRALADLCQMLFSANEFIYVD
jgi:hypothetical protein